MSMPDTLRLSSEPVRKIVIAGGGVCGWMVAAALSRMIEHGGVCVSVIESEERNPAELPEAVIPSSRTFNQLLELDENDFIRHTQGTFSLGTEFVDWHSRGTRYIRPCGVYGADLHGIQFHQLWLKLRDMREPGAGDLSAYNLCTVAAKSNRFTRPKGGPGAILATLRYALHFDAGLYAAHLRKYSEARGVRRLAGTIVEAKLSPENAFMTGLVLQDGRAVEGELFLDCSGFGGLLIAQALKVGFVDWSHWLPCDRAITVSCQRRGPLLPYTRATADVAGWRWRMPLQHRTGNGFVYCREFTSNVSAQARLLCQLDAASLADIRLLKFKTGHRRRFWEKNCIAIGASGGFIEPLEGSGVHLIQAGIGRLLASFPDCSFSGAAINSYNRYMADQYQRIRDFNILHYMTTQRCDTPFWRHCREINFPESLQEKVELFRRNGTVLQDPADLFNEQSWIAVMLGQGIIPASHDPLADSLSQESVRKFARHIRGLIASTAAAMPLHEDFVEEHCATHPRSAIADAYESYH
jgi:tryptophan 7-halogenase